MIGEASGPSRPLFVADLDGTLLGPGATLSDRTIHVVNELLAAGGLFTYATGRSFTSAARVTSALHLELPVVTYGGAVIVEPSGVARDAAMMPTEAVRAVQQAATVPESVQPILYAMHGGRDRICWLARHSTPFIEAFISPRRDDPRLFPLDSWTEIEPNTVFYASIISECQPLQQLRDRLSTDLSGCHVAFGEDIYAPGTFVIELTSSAGTKAAAVNRIRTEIQADRLVCFGDNHNDLPLFAIADLSLAVGNATPDVRRAANEVIGTNAADGVAEWLALAGNT